MEKPSCDLIESSGMLSVDANPRNHASHSFNGSQARAEQRSNVAGDGSVPPPAGTALSIIAVHY
jgi:hypothetical protein